MCAQEGIIGYNSGGIVLPCFPWRSGDVKILDKQIYLPFIFLI